MRQKNDITLKHRVVGIFVLYSVVSACTTMKQSPSLSDLKSRFWKDTYYLSVKASPKSIKCKLDPSYENPRQIPVTYEGVAAESIFNSEEDIEKIRLLQQQCVDGPPF